MRIIVNPAAAGGRVGREWAAAAERLRAMGISADEVFTEAPGHATELAREAVKAGVERVVVVGGDGTVCEAAEGLYGAQDVVLGILPMGTGNDAARTLGVPRRLEDAARIALAGHARTVDLIRMGDRLILNAIGVGFTADINRRAAKLKKVRGIAAYLITAMVSLLLYRESEVQLRSPVGDYSGDMTILAVHNGPTTGGGFPLTPAADPGDGLLDVCLVPGVGPLGRVPRLLAALRGTLGATPGAVELRTPWLELEFGRTLPVHLDGNETMIEPPRVRFEVVPAALRVAVVAEG